jgi:hypothetical protein
MEYLTEQALQGKAQLHQQQKLMQAEAQVGIPEVISVLITVVHLIVQVDKLFWMAQLVVLEEDLQHQQLTVATAVAVAETRVVELLAVAAVAATLAAVLEANQPWDLNTKAVVEEDLSMLERIKITQPELVQVTDK